MTKLMEKAKGRKGFTLMEMLIVVAIIAVLVAIAVPVFGSQLQSAKDAVQAANERSAKSMAVTQYLLDTNATGSGSGTYYAVIDGQDNMTITTSKPGSGTYYTVVMDGNGGVTSVTPGT